MPNQHTASRYPKLKEKCLRKGCKKIIIKTEGQKSNGRKKHCSVSCYRRSVEPKIYTKDIIKFVKDNITEYGYPSMAKHVGVSQTALERQITKWRQSGHAIPYLKILPLETITVRQGREFIKTVSGWVSVPKPKKEKPTLPAKPTKVIK